MMDQEEVVFEAQEKCTVTLELPGGEGETIELDLIVGSEGERAIDIRELRRKTGLITLDPSFSNTGACQSAITFIDGERGILRYRGFPIEELVEHTTFTETSLLLINGDPPSLEERNQFSKALTDQAMLHEGLRHHFEGFPPNAPPLAMLSAMINATSCYHPEFLELENQANLMKAAANLLSKVRTIAAFNHRKSLGEPIVYPDPSRTYCSNFLHMMFSLPYSDYVPSRALIDALRVFLIIHADHEQTCSASTARMVGSSGANLFASVAAAVNALWGPLHGSGNVEVIRMLQRIHDGGESVRSTIERVKRKEMLLWGFGHPVYRNKDPRVPLLRKALGNILESKGSADPLLDIAQQLAEAALNEDYFIERRLYPNVDFYSGILLRAMEIPLPMFPVMFAIGRLPGWIAQWAEGWRNKAKLHRPRQIYVGEKKRRFIPIFQRS